MKVNNNINMEIAKLTIVQRLILFAIKKVSKKTKYKTNYEIVNNLRWSNQRMQRKRLEKYDFINTLWPRR